MTKTFKSVIVVEFAYNNHEAESKEHFYAENYSEKPKESKGKAFIVAINSIGKDMTVYANSKEEAELKHNKGLSITDSYNDEDVDGSHQIEEIEFIEEVKE